MNNEELNKLDEVSEGRLSSDAGEPLTTRDMAAAAKRQPITEKSVDEGELETTSLRETGPAKSNGEPKEDEGFAPLFEEDALTEFRERWSAVQTGFVDSPRRAVEQADELVAAVMKRLAEVFAAARENLEADWTEGEDVSTEELRIALRRYRSFFDRLLSV